MQDQASSILDKTIRRLMPLWRDSNSGRRSLDKLSLTPDLNALDIKNLGVWMDSCLSDDGGEVAARAKAAALGRSFLELNETGRIRFLSFLSENYAVDESRVSEMIKHWQNSQGDERLACANA